MQWTTTVSFIPCRYVCWCQLTNTNGDLIEWACYTFEIQEYGKLFFNRMTREARLSQSIIPIAFFALLDTPACYPWKLRKSFSVLTGKVAREKDIEVSLTRSGERHTYMWFFVCGRFWIRNFFAIVFPIHIRRSSERRRTKVNTGQIETSRIFR